MKTTKYFFFLLIGIQIVSCAPAENSTKGDEQISYNIRELGYDPHSRWPEKGNFSYDFDVRFNGIRCETKQEFSSKANYCMGLQDHELNEGCALSSRQQTYKFECGQDFQEINIPSGFGISGYDSRLQKSCTTGEPLVKIFQHVSQFCQFLKNENIHKNCFWDNRRNKFEELNCKGEFSVEPAVAVPSPSPAPNPSPTPNQPMPDQYANIPVVQFLRSNGVEVTVDEARIQEDYRLDLQIGRKVKPLTEIMQNFWRELTSVQDLIIDRKINKINVTSYTSNHESVGILNFHYNLKSGEAKYYFKLYDTLKDYQAKLGLQLDVGIEGSDSDQIPFENLQKFISFLQDQYKNIFQIRNVISAIVFDSYPGYFEYNKILELRSDFAIEDFQKYFKLLLPLKDLYNWAKSENVEIDAEFDIEKDQNEIVKNFDFYSKHFQTLSLAVEAKMLKKISFSKYSKVYFHNDELELPFDSSKLTDVKLFFSCYSVHAQKVIEFKKPIKYNSTNFDSEYCNSIQKMNSAWNLILEKSPFINLISFGYSSTYYRSSKELVIGVNDSKTELIRILNGIN